MLNFAPHSTIHSVLQQATQQLSRVEQPRLETEVLLAFSLAKPRSYLYAWSDKTLNSEQLAVFTDLLKQRIAGQPIAYLTGEREFWSLPLQVSSATLIPRPETELLVEQVLHIVPAHAQVSVLDLGTGSGAIALALAQTRPTWQLLATDRCAEALAIAQANAQRLQLQNVIFQHSDWFSTLTPQKFDVIVSNPPYIADTDVHLQRGDVRFEPRQALVAGSDGLDAIRVIVAEAAPFLNFSGWLWLEHGYQQGETVRTLLQQHGYQSVATQADLAGLPRISGGQFNVG